MYSKEENELLIKLVETGKYGNNPSTVQGEIVKEKIRKLNGSLKDL